MTETNLTHCVSWTECRELALTLWYRTQEYAEKKSKTSLKLWGVPKNGWNVVQLLMEHNSEPGAYLDFANTPDEADIIIDDLKDSGKTAYDYAASHPSIPFMTLVKKVEGVWLHFPWEPFAEKDPADHVRRLLQYYGIDVNTESRRETPERVVKMYEQVLKPQKFTFTHFDASQYDQIIVSRDIAFYSLCEHHMLPFFGTVSVGYLPNKKILGLSKIARCVKANARGLHTQEFLTQNIANELMTCGLEPRGVGVIMKGRHLCQEMRGAEMKGEMVTSCMLGTFRFDTTAREELLKLIGDHR